jgi:hypothetical protein
MTRFTLALLAAVGIASAAPVPKAVKKADPFPYAVGTKWEYVRNEDETVVWAEEVTEAKEADGGRAIRIDITTNTGAKRFETYLLKGGELRLTASQNGTYEPGMLIRRADMKDGDTWENRYAINGGAESVVNCTVGKPEELTTPAGKFTAYPITRKYATGLETTYWYGDGVGLVRQTTNGRKTQELKAFTPGKK